MEETRQTKQRIKDLEKFGRIKEKNVQLFWNIGPSI